MIIREEILEIGQFNKTHGVKGEISATIYCASDDFARFSCVVSEIDGIFVPFFVSGMRPKSADTVLLTVDGFDTDVQAKALVNKTIYVLKKEYAAVSADEDCDEMPIDYFIGFEARDTDGAVLGEIVDVDDSTENVLFVIENAQGDEFSVPAVDEFIADIREDENVVVLDLPIGILDI